MPKINHSALEATPVPLASDRVRADLVRQSLEIDQMLPYVAKPVLKSAPIKRMNKIVAAC
jgi:hypothetical protein